MDHVHHDVRRQWVNPDGESHGLHFTIATFLHPLCPTSVPQWLLTACESTMQKTLLLVFIHGFKVRASQRIPLLTLPRKVPFSYPHMETQTTESYADMLLSLSRVAMIPSAIFQSTCVFLSAEHFLLSRSQQLCIPNMRREGT